MFGLKVLCLICKVTFCFKRQHIAFAPLQNFRVKWNVISSFCCLVEQLRKSSSSEFFSSFLCEKRFHLFLPQYSTTEEKKKREKKAKICKTRSLGCCRIRLISHFVRYVNYYSQRSMNFSTESNSLNSNFLTYYNFLNVTVVKRQLKKKEQIE